MDSYLGFSNSKIEPNNVIICTTNLVALPLQIYTARNSKVCYSLIGIKKRNLIMALKQTSGVQPLHKSTNFYRSMLNSSRILGEENKSLNQTKILSIRTDKSAWRKKGTLTNFFREIYNTSLPRPEMLT